MMLDVQALRTGYGRIPILNGVSFSVSEGEFVGILGHNGMGKTTLLKALMGFLPATAGRVLFNQERRHDGRALSPRAARARLCAAGARDFPGADGLRQSAHGLQQARRPEQDIISAVLEEFPRLKTLLDRAGGALSGGEQQLLAIARCLCGQPRLVLLDEPTEGIQPSIIDEIIETLQRLRANSGLTMILVEQNLEFIAALSQRILDHSEGSDHPGGAARRPRRRQPCRRICRNRNLSPISRAIRGRPSHGRQETHSRAIAQRSRRPRHAYGRRGAQILRRADAGELCRLRRGRCHAGLRPRREIPADARLSSRRRGEQIQRLVRQDR